MKFDKRSLQQLWRPRWESKGEENGQITVVGGSELFSGAPLLTVIACSRMVDMVFVATPFEDKKIVHNVELFSHLRSVIWVARENLDEYIEKSDVVVMGPGLMRGMEARLLTRKLLRRFGHKRWVVDAGSLQTMERDWIPKGAIVTPNEKEFQQLFGVSCSKENVERMARRHTCVVVSKGAKSYVSDGETTYVLAGGNPGLTHGGTGDVLAGVIGGLAAKNPALLAGAAGVFLVKKTAEALYKRVGTHYSADDLAQKVFEVEHELLTQ